MQQLPLQQSEQHSLESNFVKYLPNQNRQKKSSLSNQEHTLYCNPENYMLMLSYATSLENENKSLRQSLSQTKKELEEVNKRISQYQIGYNSAFGNNLVFNRCSHDAQPLPSFNRAKNNRPLTERQAPDQLLHHQQAKVDSICHLNLKQQIIASLKQQNDHLSAVIQQLYNQRIAMIERQKSMIQQGFSQTMKQNKNKSNFSQTFSQIKLSHQQSIKQIKRQHSRPSFNDNISNNQKASAIADKIYCSQPNSFEISFMLPSFKSLKNC